MLPGLTGAMTGLAGRLPTFKETLDNLALTTNLKLCLDAGDPASYSSGQKWLDRSGGGYDFFRGADATATTDDPTFNGTAGGQSGSEYWSFDGGDYFSYDTSNETWMEALHKDSAVFSFVFWTYVKTPATQAALFGTARVGADTGVNCRYDNASPPRLTLSVTNAASAVYSLAPAIDLVVDAWNFISVSINEPANTSAVNINGSASAGTATYSSPAAGAASYAMNIAAGGNNNIKFASGARLASVAFWQGTALSAANLASIYQNTRAKFAV